MSQLPEPRSTRVEPDHFEVALDDTVFDALLDSTFVICFYDAVQDTGALVHLRSGPPGRAQDANLTDTTLSSDLLLIDRCLEQLRHTAPRAQHWQARLLAHVVPSSGAQARFQGIRELLEGFLLDSGVTLVSCDISATAGQQLCFRPAMGKAWISDG